MKNKTNSNQLTDEILQIEDVASTIEVVASKKKKKKYVLGISYKNIGFLLQIIGDRAMIPSSRVTKFSPRDQKKLSRAIKRARFLGLLPYIS